MCVFFYIYLTVLSRNLSHQKRFLKKTINRFLHLFFSDVIINVLTRYRSNMLKVKNINNPIYIANLY